MIILTDFILESNAIEGIYSPPTNKQIEIAKNFIELPYLRIADIANFVEAFQPQAFIRSVHGMDVRVGNHFPPRGGPEIVKGLSDLLASTNFYSDYDRRAMQAYEFHIDYETLHPFTDGNGRSGRIIWLHMMGGYEWLEASPYGFLHTWYYHSLNYARKTAVKNR